VSVPVRPHRQPGDAPPGLYRLPAPRPGEPRPVL